MEFTWPALALWSRISGHENSIVCEAIGGPARCGQKLPREVKECPYVRSGFTDKSIDRDTVRVGGKLGAAAPCGKSDQPRSPGWEVFPGGVRKVFCQRGDVWAVQTGFGWPDVADSGADAAGFRADAGAWRELRADLPHAADLVFGSCSGNGSQDFPGRGVGEEPGVCR